MVGKLATSRRRRRRREHRPRVPVVGGPIPITLTDHLSANRTLSANQASPPPPGWGCNRALTVANNVAIDVRTCSANQSTSAVNIAHHIAGKVPLRRARSLWPCFTFSASAPQSVDSRRTPRWRRRPVPACADGFSSPMFTLGARDTGPARTSGGPRRATPEMRAQSLR